MADIFDVVDAPSAQAGGDVFDEVAAADIFDQVAEEPKSQGAKESAPAAPAFIPGVPDPRALNPMAAMSPEDRHAPVYDLSRLVPESWNQPVTVRGTPFPNPAGAVAGTAAGIGNFFLSPQGFMEGMTAATPAGPVVVAKWLYDMMTGAVAAGKQAVDVYNEPGQLTPEKQQQMLGAIVGASAMAAGAAGIGKQGVTALRKLKPEPKLEGPSEFGGEVAPAAPEATVRESRIVEKPAEAAPAVDVFDQVAVDPTIRESRIVEAAPAETAAAMPLGILAGELQRTMGEGKAIPATWVEQYNAGAEAPWALRPGYKLEGAEYVFKPEVVETSAARMAREQREAMAGIREAKAKAEAEKVTEETKPTEPQKAEPKPEEVKMEESGDPDWSVPEEARRAMEEPVEGGGFEMERPPDVLDWVEGNFPGGVKLPSKADYGEYLNRAAGRAADLLSLKKGDAADEVIREMHDQGQWRRIETVDDLAEAMLRAGEARKGWRLEQWANKKVNEGAKRLGTFGALDPELLAAYTIKGAAVIGRGVKDFAVWSAEMVKEFGELIKPHLDQIFQEAQKAVKTKAGPTELPPGMAERQTGVKIRASEAVSDQTKESITEYLYQQRSNATDQVAADTIVKNVGIDQAWAVWKQPPAQLPGAVRSKLLGTITRALAQQEGAARQGGDVAAADALAKRQAAMWNEALPMITDLAQSLQAMRDMVVMSPEAQVARAELQVERVAQETMERRRAEVDATGTAIVEGHRAGMDQVRNDPETNAAARTAVNETIKGSEETKAAVIMELAQPWASSSVVLEHARKAVAAKADELLNRAPRPPGLTPREHLRQILDDLAARSATIFAGHMQGAEPGTPLVDKFQLRLGLTREKATQLATALTKEWDAQVKAATAKLDGRLAAARARQNQREAEMQTQDAVDRAIRRQLTEWNTRLGEVIRMEASRRDATGRHVADRVVQTSGLKGAAAEQLRATLERRWNELVQAAQESALQGIEARSGVKVSRQVRSAFDKLVELDRLGALTGTKHLETVRAALKLKEKLEPKEAAELLRLARAAHTAPEGWQQQRAQGQVLTYIERLKGELGWIDAPWAIWYANIFSAPPTHVANVIGNTAKLMETVAQEIVHRPLAAPQILAAVGRGLSKGALEAANVMTTGSPEGSRLLKAEASRPLEALHLPGAWDYAMTPWRVVTRAMASEDMVFFKANEEVRWTLLARQVARREGLPMFGPKLASRVQELLHNSSGEHAAARVTAAKEGLSGIDARRRANEIVEQGREASMPGATEAARGYALKQTYNGNPYGLMGEIAGVLAHVNNKLVVTRFAMPVIRIMANISNESLNYFPPVGLTRLALAKWGPAEMMGGKVKFRNRLDGKPIENADQIFNLGAQASVGLLLFGGLTIALANELGKANAQLAVYGQGPRDKNQRELLRTTGWIPNSVKVGDRYFSYQETQLAIPMAILGNYFDAVRWQKLEQKDALNRLTFAMLATSYTVLDQRMLSGLRDVLTGLGRGVFQSDTQDLVKAAARPAASFVVPNVVRWVDQLFDPAMYEAHDVQGQILQQIPVARREGSPAVNAFGEPITRGPMERFTSPDKPSELVKVLAQKGAWVPVPSLDSLVVGDRSKGDDHYRPMRPDEYFFLIQESGQRIRDRLELNLDRIIDMEDDQAKAFVRKVTSEERARIAKQLKFLD